MGISIEDAINHELLSKDVLNCIPTKCKECGSPVEFTDSLKQAYCTNRFCSSKIAARLQNMAKELKVEGWDSNTCREVCKCFNLKSPYQVFLLEKEIAKGAVCFSVDDFESKIHTICSTEKRKVKLWEVVKLAGITSLETIAYKIFGGYKSLAEAYADIEKLQVPFVAERLGLKNIDTGVLAVSVYKSLLAHKNELMFGESQFEIIQMTGKEVYIAINGGVQGFSNNSEFINFISKKYNGKVNVMLTNSVTYKVNALVTDGDKSSNKYLTAIRLQEKGSNIVITDSLGLIKWIDENYL